MARLTKMTAFALAGIALAVVAMPSCDDGTVSDADCDLVVRRCSTYCDYYSSSCSSYYYGCCYDRCWYDCAGRRNREPVVQPAPPSSAPATDAGPAPPPASDGGDFGVLCAACTSNEDCKGGGLCIQRGGEDAGTPGFCGLPCTGNSGCPAEFTCAVIGQSQQCVPTSGTCN